jgi:hypothetical protein
VFTARRKVRKEKIFSLSALFSFAGVSAAKEKAVDFAVFAPLAKPRERDKPRKRDRRAVRYRNDNVIELVDARIQWQQLGRPVPNSSLFALPRRSIKRPHHPLREVLLFRYFLGLPSKASRHAREQNQKLCPS